MDGFSLAVTEHLYFNMMAGRIKLLDKKIATLEESLSWNGVSCVNNNAIGPLIIVCRRRSMPRHHPL
jgi:hypothetical protein